MKVKGIPVPVYEPTLGSEEFFDFKVTHELEAFKQWADVIAACRWSGRLVDVGVL